MSTTMQAAPGESGAKTRYDAVARAFHWLVAALLVVQFLTELLPRVLPARYEDSFVGPHVSIGPTILLLMVLRLGWRLTHTPPVAPRDLSPPLRLLSRATHWLFYAGLIVLPVLGWLTASAFGVRASLLGLVPLPMLVAKDQAFGDAVGQVHGALALAILALVALHVAGALYHALVKRDGVLQRMLPRLGGPQAGRGHAGRV